MLSRWSRPRHDGWETLGPAAEVSRIGVSDTAFCLDYGQAVGLNLLLWAKETQGTVQPELLTSGCYLFSISDFCSVLTRGAEHLVSGRYLC